MFDSCSISFMQWSATFFTRICECPVNEGANLGSFHVRVQFDDVNTVSRKPHSSQHPWKVKYTLAFTVASMWTSESTCMDLRLNQEISQVGSDVGQSWQLEISGAAQIGVVFSLTDRICSTLPALASSISCLPFIVTCFFINHCT